MSSSELNSKIDFEDGDKEIRKKINKAFSVDGKVEGNGLLALLKYVIFRKLELDQRKFSIDRPEKYGGNISFSNYLDVENAFAGKKLASVDLKQGVAEEIISLISPLRLSLEKNSKLYREAYP